MTVTIKSVSERVVKTLCAVPIQDFEAASRVRDVQRATDPEGTKNLTDAQALVVKAFFEIVCGRAIN